MKNNIKVYALPREHLETFLTRTGLKVKVVEVGPNEYIATFVGHYAAWFHDECGKIEVKGYSAFSSSGAIEDLKDKFSGTTLKQDWQGFFKPRRVITVPVLI